MAAKGTAQLERLKRREDARQYREDEALRYYASGLTLAEITGQLSGAFGTSRTSVSNTGEMIRRALRRHSVGPEDVDMARSRMLASLDVLLEAWMPLALGQGLDADLRPRNPSDKAATIVLGILDRYAQVTGAVKPPERSTHITVITTVPTDAESKRLTAMDEIRREAQKLVIIDGELAHAGTSLEANRHGGGITNELMPSPVPKKEKKP